MHSLLVEQNKTHRLEGGAQLRSGAADPQYHAELAQVGLDFPHVLVCLENGDALQRPARGHPRVLVEEDSPVLPLVLGISRSTSGHD